MRDLTVVLENVPGSLASLGESLGEAGLNIEGCSAISDGDGTVVHILVEDAARVRHVLAASGFDVREEQPVLSIYVSGDDRPGLMGRYARRIADAGVNIDRMHLAAGSRLAFVTDDQPRARAAIRG